jgi:hypothetical protein
MVLFWHQSTSLGFLYQGWEWAWELEVHAHIWFIVVIMWNSSPISKLKEGSTNYMKVKKEPR